MPQSVLVINSGSSSIKFSLIDIKSEKVLISGLAEKLGLDDASITVKTPNKQSSPLSRKDHVGAMEAILSALRKRELLEKVAAVGHRVVHGGEHFKNAVRITSEVIEQIEKCVAFAPLHNPAHLEGIKAAMTFAPEVPHVAVFDTAFHQTMPTVSYLYALPYSYYEQYGIRRYGFHGTSYRYVCKEAAKLLNIPLEKSAFVAAHLGNGASATAILNGQSVDTSMGFTPLEGLVMGTRSGDLDPSLVAYLAEVMKTSAAEVVQLLNKKSGLLGISHLSSDVRELQQAADEGHEGAILAIEIFVHRLAKYIGALSTNLPRVDALIFTGGIGENSVLIREKTIKRLAVLGYQLDAEANKNRVGSNQGIITSPNSTKALMINTNEELMIAQDTTAFL